MKKALSIISDHIQKVLSDSNFERINYEEENKVLFVGDKITYGIFFNIKKSCFDFKFCENGEPQDDTNWKQLSSWLFEPGVGTHHDAEMIALDFEESILGYKKKQKVTPHKKKRDSERSIDLNFFTNRILSFFPELRDNFKIEKENYENFRYIIFVENYVVPKINNLLQEPIQKDRIKKFVALLNNMYSDGNLDVRGIITIVILRNIENSKKRELLKNYMDDELKKAWKAADNLKGKKIKPEKQKIERKNKYMADTLQK